ncbi:MAG TPA: hypothetical protein ENJ09_12605 [Planctomycetes bacterium]|nr:hypothetical protein [Planctomycetota bacterium]
MTRTTGKSVAAALLGVTFLVVACAVQRPSDLAQHRWWRGLGPVLPHDSFPMECTTCHAGGDWGTLVEDFSFDHEQETGVALEGAHENAQCLRCHNDRGPVAAFAAVGCLGCHDDAHFGELGEDCEQCHDQRTWRPRGQIEMHARTRFPLVGVHAATSCRRCHVGAEVGNFVPTDTECLTCHRDDYARATNHPGLGYVDRCDRCHLPTNWNQAEVHF